MCGPGVRPPAGLADGFGMGSSPTARADSPLWCAWVPGSYERFGGVSGASRLGGRRPDERLLITVGKQGSRFKPRRQVLPDGLCESHGVTAPRVQALTRP